VSKRARERLVQLFLKKVIFLFTSCIKIKEIEMIKMIKMVNNMCLLLFVFSVPYVSTSNDNNAVTQSDCFTFIGSIEHKSGSLPTYSFKVCIE